MHIVVYYNTIHYALRAALNGCIRKTRDQHTTNKKKCTQMLCRRYTSHTGTEQNYARGKSGVYMHCIDSNSNSSICASTYARLCISVNEYMYAHVQPRVYESIAVNVES